MAVRVLEVRRSEAMPLAATCNTSEKRFHRSTPGHLREFVHCANQERGQKAVDLLVHDHDRQSLVLCLALCERAAAVLVPAVGNGPAKILLDLDVDLLVDLGSAPRAERQLGGRT